MAPTLACLAVWSLLIAAPLRAPWTGAEGAVLAVQGAAALLLLATRPHSAGGRPTPVTSLALGLGAGYASFPAWVFAAVVIGVGLGLPARAPIPPGSGSPALWAGALVAAPVFEELLYRERLLDALRPRLGAGAAVALTSVLFAVSHLEPWQMLATFLVGLGLGALRAAGGPVGLCIAAHAGLNLASLTAGSPPVRLALAPLPAAALGLGAAALAVTTAARRRLETEGARAGVPCAGAAGG